MMKKIFKADSWFDIVKHLLIAGVFFALLLVMVFYIYLPVKTKKDNSITVPDIIGMEHSGIHEFITERELLYVVLPDSGYNAELPPLAVISQFPKPNAKVKEGRKIYLTLNSVNPPQTEMPDLIGKSLQTVKLQFDAMGVKIGRYNFTPGPYKNTFVSAEINGSKIEAGQKIPKGSVIDLYLQNGRGQQYFDAPDVIGKDKERAELIIAGSSLNIGEIYYEKADSLQGLVIKQLPAPGSRVRIGQKFNLWISVSDSSLIDNSLPDPDND